MNRKKIILIIALGLNCLAASSQTTVFLTQLNSKTNESQVVIVDSEGKQTIVKTLALSVRNFSEGLASIQTMDKKFGFIDLKGELVIPSKFSAVGYFKNGLAWAKDESGKAGFINKAGNWVVQPEFDAVKSFDEVSGMARVKKGDQWYYVNQTGEALMVDSDAYWDFSEGLCLGEKNGLRGYFNNKAEWVIAPQFTDAKKFVNGQALAKVNGKWGIIDKTGKWVMEAKFDVIKDVEVLE